MVKSIKNKRKSSKIRRDKKKSLKRRGESMEKNEAKLDNLINEHLNRILKLPNFELLDYDVNDVNEFDELIDVFHEVFDNSELNDPEIWGIQETNGSLAAKQLYKLIKGLIGKKLKRIISEAKLEKKRTPRKG